MGELTNYFAFNTKVEKEDYDKSVTEVKTSRVEKTGRKSSVISFKGGNIYSPANPNKKAEKFLNEILKDTPELEIPEHYLDIKELYLEQFDDTFVFLVPEKYTHYRIVLNDNDNSTTLKLKCDYPERVNYLPISFHGVFTKVENNKGIIQLTR
ncbi:Uncharacterised protein [Candidatus Tiddalikarchaeum anstoanum]|nr:Uncharacterised protein [Candidatus Tiddalikarchaeum anstoanum]